jgi:hypothetical protein
MKLIANTGSKGLAVMVFIVAAALYSCKKAEIKKQTAGQTAVQTTPADVYVAGNVLAANGNTVAAYWKNGILVKLGDPIVNSYAYNILVSGSDIYVGGRSYTPTTHSKVIYWHNGVATELTDGSIECDIAGLALSGSNLYIAGNFNELNGKEYPAHWVNTPASLVIDSTLLTYETGVVINGPDIYVSGFKFKEWANNFTGVEMKNNQPTTLLFHTMAMGIATSGPDVYMCGALYSNMIDFSSVVYWKNGIPTLLGDITTAIQFASSIAVNSSDVYVAGWIGEIGNKLIPKAVWKNGKVAVLQGSTSSSGANRITVAGNDVYVTGEINGSPGYWLNGVPVKLPGLVC